MTSTSNNKAQFNSSASSYDDEFTFSKIGVLQRKRVYYWLNQIAFFEEEKKIFEINCGTGYDAEQFHKKGHSVIATDVSDGMIAYAKKQRNPSIDFEVQSFHKASQNSILTDCDVLFSNFGGLNCINSTELTTFLNGTALLQKKGAQVILVIMSKKCLMESIYFFFKLNFPEMSRRNTTNGIEVKVKNERVKTYYYYPKDIVKKLTPSYNVQLVKPVASFIPPSYLEPFFKKKKRLLGFIYKLEQLFGSFTFMAKWADHYIIVAKKK